MTPIQIITEVADQVRKTGEGVVSNSILGGRLVKITVSRLPSGGIEIKQQPLLCNAKVAKNNTSGVTGVRWNKSQEKWIASVKVNGKYIWLGTFRDKNKAVERRIAYEKDNGFYPRRHLV